MGKGKGTPAKAGKAPTRRKEKVTLVERLTTLVMLTFLLSLGAERVLALTTGG